MEIYTQEFNKSLFFLSHFIEVQGFLEVKLENSLKQYCFEEIPLPRLLRSLLLFDHGPAIQAEYDRGGGDQARGQVHPRGQEAIRLQFARLQTLHH